MTMVSERLPSAGNKMVHICNQTISMMDKMNQNYDLMRMMMTAWVEGRSLSPGEQTQVDNELRRICNRPSNEEMIERNSNVFTKHENIRVPITSTEEIQKPVEKLKKQEENSIAELEEESAIEEVKKDPKMIQPDGEHLEYLKGLLLGKNPLQRTRATEKIWFAGQKTMDVEESDSGRRLEKTTAKKMTSSLGKAFGPEFHQNEFKLKGLGLILVEAQQEINENNLIQQAQLQQSYEASKSFPCRWINIIWREEFNVTAMDTAGSKWATIMSRGAGFSDQIVELDFIYPNEGAHKRWDAGYLITSTATTWEQSDLQTYIYPNTYAKEEDKAQIFIQCHSNPILPQLSILLRPPRKPPDYIDHSNLEDKVHLRGVDVIVNPS